MAKNFPRLVTNKPKKVSFEDKPPRYRIIQRIAKRSKKLSKKSSDSPPPQTQVNFKTTYILKRPQYLILDSDPAVHLYNRSRH